MKKSLYLSVVTLLGTLLFRQVTCRPSERHSAGTDLEDEFLDLLGRRHESEQSPERHVDKKHHRHKGASYLPRGYFWGGEEWTAYEYDGRGHGHDVIDDMSYGIDSIPMVLFAGFEVVINGTLVMPKIDWKHMHVQLAQNEDHHYSRAFQTRNIERRNFAQTTLWENGIIPYTIDYNSISRADRQAVIREGIEEMNTMTCLRIVPREEAPATPHQSFIRFINDGEGCWSYVGRVFSTNQNIGLGNNCYDKTTVIHEIMHAIGMHHEHQRSDRDSYVNMVWQNIEGGQGNENMRVEQTDDENPYDAESILQYGLYSFTENGGRTMYLKDSKLEFLVNTAKGLTFYDVKDITDGYNCTQKCNQAPACINTGFVGWTCECVCPSGLKGSSCGELDSDPDCGEIINLSSGSSRTIESPGYPQNHPTDKHCVWLIRGPANSKINLTIENLDLRYNTANSRCYHWLEVRYNLLGQPGPKRCGQITSETWQTSSANIEGNNNMMMLKFDSRFSKDISGNKGFRLRVTAVGGDPTPPGNCNPNPCQNGGACTVSPTSYTCQCASGYTGVNCETKLALPCDSNPCKNGGVCTNSGADYSCQCTGGWTGSTCEVISSGGLICTFEPTTACFLRDGFTPKEATSATTPSTAVSGKFYVTPSSNYVTLWLDTAKARITNGRQYCLEFSYFIKGSNVEVAVYDESDTTYTNPLKKWTTETTWTKAVFSFTANTNRNPMLDIYYPSETGSGAVDDVTLKEGSCSTTPSPCDSGPCNNGGSCTNAGTSFTCQCADGWTGTTCQTQEQPCDSLPCKNGGTCSNSGTTFTCTCDQDWTGDTCEVQVKPCDSLPCKNGGTCSNSGTTFTCTCDQGWTGDTCEEIILPCDSLPCKNGGTCSNSGTTFTCTCDQGWTGDTCEDIINPCDALPCLNGGMCLNSGMEFTCTCGQGWTGDFCGIVATTTTTPRTSSSTTTMISPTSTTTTITSQETTATTTATRICTFEPNTPCFLVEDYVTTEASPQTLLSIAVSGSYFVAPVSPSNYVTLKMDHTQAGLVNGQPYCLEFAYSINSDYTEVAVYAESDENYLNPLSRWTSKRNWTMVTYTFTAKDGDNPMLDIYYTQDTGFAAIDDVMIREGQCPAPPSPCDTSPCKNGGTCTDSTSTFACQCTGDWKGPTCEELRKPCDSSPCKNGGTCTNAGDAYTCTCTPDWKGQNCTDTVSKVCTFEPETTCFLRKGYTVKKASSQTQPSTAYSGEYFVAPSTGSDYVTLKINETAAGLVHGQRYCLKFAYTVTSNDVEVGIYSESDTSFSSPHWLWRGPRSWTRIQASFTARSGNNPVIDIYYYDADIGHGAVDDVSISSGSC